MTATTVTDGNGTTHFFDVDGRLSDGVEIVRTGPHRMEIHNVNFGRAMLFIPREVSVVTLAPMLVYYHGHHGPASIEGYVAQQKERDFRPLLKSKKVLLVEPQGGPVSRFGRLGDPAGLSALIFRAMQAALELRPPAASAPKKVPMPPSIILVGFSGGGAALNNVVLEAKADYVDRITEVWSFDSMYSGEGKKWADWATASKKTLRVRLSTEEGTGKPRAQGEVIRAAIKAKPASNIDIDKVIESTHEGLPGMFIPGWL